MLLVQNTGLRTSFYPVYQPSIAKKTGDASIRPPASLLQSAFIPLWLKRLPALATLRTTKKPQCRITT